MAKNCVFEHCENKGENREINFVVDETQKKFHANVRMCQACYREIWRQKRSGTLMRCDVLYRSSHTHVDFDATRNIAIVEEMRLSSTQEEHGRETTQKTPTRL